MSSKTYSEQKENKTDHRKKKSEFLFVAKHVIIEFYGFFFLKIYTNQYTNDDWMEINRF